MGRAVVAVFALVALVGCAEGAPGADTSGDGGNGGDGSGGSGAASVCGPLVDGSRCMDNGWCWDAPRPQAVHFEDVDGTPDGSSIFAVGTLGGAFRRCQGAWVPIETNTAASLYGVWHLAPDLAWAVGEAGTILRWNGEEWTKVPSPADSTLRAVWGAAPDDIWIGGVADEQGAVLLHFDGKSITRVGGEVVGYAYDIVSIDGRSATDIFAVGGSWEYDVSLRWDGFNWTMLPGGHGYPDFGPFKQVVALADGTTIANFDGYNTSRLFRYQGFDWTEIYYRGDAQSLHALFSDYGDRAQIVESSPGGTAPYALSRFEADTWTPTGETMPALPDEVWWRGNSDEAWAVGADSVLLGHAPWVWSQVPEIAAFPSGPLFIGGKSEDDLWVVTDKQVAHRDATGWLLEWLPTEWASGASVDVDGRIWVVSEYQDVMYRDAGEWKTLPGGAGGSIYSLLPISPDDVWIRTDYQLMHFYGGVWEIYSEACPTFHDPTEQWSPTGYTLRRAPDGTVWLVGDRGAFAFDSAHSCKLLTGPGGATFENDPLVDVAWTGSGEIWALSTKGNLYQRQGNSLVFRADLLGQATTEGATVQQLVGTPSGKLRLVYENSVEVGTEYEWRTYIATFDPAAGQSIGKPLTTPADGVVWIADDERVVVAIDGGVLRYGYQE